jgi:hypothetical protein
MEYDFYKRFEKLIEQIFTAFNYNVETIRFGRDWGADLIIIDNKIKSYCEVKFYRSKNTPNSTIKAASEQLAYYLKQKKDGSGLLIVSSYVNEKLKDEIKESLNIVVWDRSDLYNLLQSDSPKSNLLSDFEKLLIEAKQGVDTDDVFQDVEKRDKAPETYFQELNYLLNFSIARQPRKRGELLCKEINKIKEGKDGWRDFELKCEEILKYLFSDDLSIWNRQATTDDELSRFDLICRITSNDDFWKTIVQSFHSRYILFEFKNYSKQIGQNQVYTTERYLFTKALRSVSFIIARNGANEQAITASKGALREHGKLILMLDRKDLCKMLEIKDNGGIPNDYLSQLLDEYLISLSR